MVKLDKLKKSIKNLENALKYEERIPEDQFYMAGISKCYEVSLEYAWKYMRSVVVNEGLDAYGPKETIKTAGRMELIDNVEEWLKFINDRNLAVHDYAIITDEQYLNSAKMFLNGYLQKNF